MATVIHLLISHRDTMTAMGSAIFSGHHTMMKDTMAVMMLIMFLKHPSLPILVLPLFFAQISNRIIFF